MKIKKGDKVLVRTGKDKGKQGKVLFVFGDKNSVLVEGVNFRTKYKKKTAQGKGDMVSIEFPINASNVVVLGTDGKPTRVGYKHDSKGKKYRVAKSNGENLDNLTKVAKSKKGT